MSKKTKIPLLLIIFILGVIFLVAGIISFKIGESLKAEAHLVYTWIGIVGIVVGIIFLVYMVYLFFLEMSKDILNEIY